MVNLLVDNIIFEIQKIGGISIYWAELLRRLLSDSDFNLVFAGLPGNHNNYIFQNLLEECPQLKEIRTWKPFVNNRYLPLIYPTNKTPLVFHSSYYRSLYSPNSCQIVTVHDFMYEIFDKGLRRKVHTLQKRNAIANADVVICISQNTKKDLLHYFPEFSNKDIRVVYNGVSDNYYKANYSYNGRPYLLVVGNRVGCKNFEVTMRSYVSVLHENYDLVIVGKPLNEYESTILSPYLDSVKIFSGIPEEKLNELYNNASALLFPSTYEGFGIPIIEAMKASCPVITTTASCMKEVAGEAGIYLETISEEGMIDAVSILRNKNYVEEIKRKGLIQASNFSWDKTYRQVKDIYYEQYKKNFK